VRGSSGISRGEPKPITSTWRPCAAGQGALSAPALARSYPKEALLAKLRGRLGGGRMEIYTERALPDSDVDRIVAYLAQIPPDPPIKDIPLLTR